MTGGGRCSTPRIANHGCWRALPGRLLVVLNLYVFFLKNHGVSPVSFENGTWIPLLLAIVFGMLAVRFFYLEIRAANWSMPDTATSRSGRVLKSIA